MPAALIQIEGAGPAGIERRRLRLPAWLRKGQRHPEAVTHLRGELRGLGLHTVCEAARCPNIDECFHRGTATFLILGEVCTRGCGFCAVSKASPENRESVPDPEEPLKVARMAARMGLRHVVITSVSRDDLDDGGSGHFAATVREVRRALPGARVEVLTPDFGGDPAAVGRVLEAGPDVFNHNVETVARLYARVRPQADYRRSLSVLESAKQHRPEALTKSGLMVGLGEKPAEVEELLGDLRGARVEVATIGQYLQPTRHHAPVAEYVRPEQFETYRQYGLAIGFKAVFSGSLVRSSYMAERVSAQARGAGH